MTWPAHQFHPGQLLQFDDAFPGPAGENNFYNIAVGLGLGGNLKLCLDAGSAASYSGSGPSWLDLPGNGYDFFLGSSGSAGANDPMFNGSAGALSANEYWSFDGGDRFTYDTTNETWMNNLHKSGAQWAVAGLLYVGALDASNGILGTTSANSSNIGVDLTLQTAGTLQLVFRNGSGSIAAVETINAAITMTAGAWHFFGISIDEAAGTTNLNWNMNGTQDTDDVAFSSPSASDATLTLEIGARGGGNAQLRNLSRLAGFLMWEGRHLSHAEIDSLWQAMRGRVGL
jgi:hypothetical protein